MMTAPMMMAPMPPPGPEPSALPLVGGIMFLLAFLIGLGLMLPLGLAAMSAAGTVNSMIPGMGGLAAMGAIFGIMMILGVVGCLIAMIFSFMKKKWMLAVIGGVLALVGLHLLFGLIGFILVLVSKKSFAD
jgi:hypothetical protein